MQAVDNHGTDRDLPQLSRSARQTQRITHIVNIGLVEQLLTPQRLRPLLNVVTFIHGNQSVEAGDNLWQMRWSMRVALFAILAGFTVLVVAIWVHSM